MKSTHLVQANGVAALAVGFALTIPTAVPAAFVTGTLTPINPGQFMLTVEIMVQPDVEIGSVDVGIKVTDGKFSSVSTKGSLFDGELQFTSSILSQDGTLLRLGGGSLFGETAPDGKFPLGSAIVTGGSPALFVSATVPYEILDSEGQELRTDPGREGAPLILLPEPRTLVLLVMGMVAFRRAY